MSKTIAQTFADLFYHNAGRWVDEDDRCGRLNIPAGFLAAWCARAWRVEFPDGTDSFDATERWTFNDDSMVEIDNPGQACYCIRVRVVNND